MCAPRHRSTSPPRVAGVVDLPRLIWGGKRVNAAAKGAFTGSSRDWEGHSMTTFNDREKGFENKFAHDADLKFKAESRRNKALAEWAGAKLGFSGAELEDYVKAVRKADLAEKGDDDVFGKVKADLAAKGVAVADADIRKVMNEALAKAVTDIEGGK